MKKYSFNRSERINILLQQTLSEIFQKDLQDPRIKLVTITKIKTTDNLQHAEVLVSIYDNEENQKKAVDCLNNAQRYIRKILAEKLNLRITPTLRFKLDKSIEYSVYISSLLKEKENER